METVSTWKPGFFMFLIFSRSTLVRMGFSIWSTRQFGRTLPQQVAAGTHIDRGVGDDFLTDGVNGRVGNLGKELLEVVEQRLVILAQHGQRDVDAHGAGGLCSGLSHGENGRLDILIGVAEGFIQPVALFLRCDWPRRLLGMVSSFR